jgi:integrase
MGDDKMATIRKQEKSPYWFVVFRRDGKQFWRATGTEDEDLARQVADEVEHVLKGQLCYDRIRDLLAEVARVTTDKLPEVRTPLAGLIELYRAQRPPKLTLEKTRQEKLAKVRQWLRWQLQHYPEIQWLHELREEHAGEYMNHLWERGDSGQTQNSKLSALHDVFQVIRVKARLQANIWAGVSRVTARHIPKQALSMEQCQQIFAVAKHYESRVEADFWPAAIALAFHTGLRLGDIAELDGTEYSTERGELKLVENKKWQKGQALTHPFHDDFARYLPAGVKGSVWPKAAAAYGTRANWLFAEFGKICRACDIETDREPKPGERRHKSRKVKLVGFHSLRATYVTEALDRGASLDDVQRVVGHGSPAMTEHYNQSQAAAQRVAPLMPTLGE